MLLHVLCLGKGKDIFLLFYIVGIKKLTWQPQQCAIYNLFIVCRGCTAEPVLPTLYNILRPEWPKISAAE
jgi:hypothetical protein